MIDRLTSGFETGEPQPFGRRRQAPRALAAKVEPRLPSLRDLGFDPDDDSELTEFRAALRRRRFVGGGGWKIALAVLVLAAMNLAVIVAGSQLYLLLNIPMLGLLFYRGYRYRRSLDDRANRFSRP